MTRKSQIIQASADLGIVRDFTWVSPGISVSVSSGVLSGYRPEGTGWDLEENMRSWKD